MQGIQIAERGNRDSAMERPTLDQYPAWARENIGFDPENEQFRRRYAQNTRSIKTSIEQSDDWGQLSAAFEMLSERYEKKFGVKLFTENGWRPNLHIKPLESVVEKTYRVNILRNRQFPAPSRDVSEGWLKEENLFSRLNDIVRCRVVCRYMDGPRYICDGIGEILGGERVAGSHSMETELGYYAWHLGVLVPAAVIKPNGHVDDEKIQFEVQLTTHLNDVLNDLTHSFYEDRRVERGRRDALWKWQPENPQFKGAFFGHTLHLLEGMIVELKNEISKGGKDD